jgi:hypothetical protein
MRFWSRPDPIIGDILGKPSLIATSDNPITEEIHKYSLMGKVHPQLHVYMWDLDNLTITKEDWTTYGYDNQRSGCYLCEESFIQSKIVNYENFDVTGNLSLKLQNFSGGNWHTVRTVINHTVTIPSNNLVKLDIGQNNDGWNFQDVRPETTGNYRVLLQFEEEANIYEKTWEFEVL